MKFYFVKPGDTLSSTASLYDTTVEEILKINDIENPDLIDPNYAVLIPKSARLCPFPQREVVIRREEEVDNVVTLDTSNNADSISPNQVLRVSVIEPVSKLTSEHTFESVHTSIPTQPLPTQKYELQAGDNLFKIADRFNTTVGTLVSINNITDPDLIYTGREILVPETEEEY